MYPNILFTILTLVLLAFASEDTPHTRKTLHVAGTYTADRAGSHVFKDQMYVEHLVPVGGATKPFPLVFIHGLAQTGTACCICLTFLFKPNPAQNWLTKPDGSPGWSSYFLSHGYECYLLDVPSRGRSSWALPPNTNLSYWTQSSAEIIQQRFTAPENYNLYPTAHLHTQWPSGYRNGVMGDPSFDAYFASTVPSIIDPILQQSAIQDAGAKLLKRIGTKAILIGHSQGGVPLWLIADRVPQFTQMIVALEPAGPPFQDSAVFGRRDARPWGLSDIPLTYTPRVLDPSLDLVKKRIPPSNGSEGCVLQADDPPPRKLTNLKDLKTLVVQAEASWHVLYDWCTVKFLRQAGVDAELVDLASKGVKGNGHMLMLEKNSDAVAEVVKDWIERS